MQLYCVSSGLPAVSEESLVDALTAAGGEFPRFDEGNAWSATSASGQLVAAAIHHPDELVGHRSYRAREGDVVVAFDGLPLHRSGAWGSQDASRLLAHWDDLRDVTEGQFSAVRIDLAREEAAFLTDSFGIAPLYLLRQGGGFLVANSVEVLRLLGGVDAASPLGVSSFASLGWAVEDTTLLVAVRALRGGREYRLSRGRLTEIPYLTPATVAAQARSGRAITTDEIVRDLLDLTSSALAAGVPIWAGLTAGRDTRLVLALLLACGADNVRYYTGGEQGQPDVDGACSLAQELDLDHRVRSLDVLDEVDWVALTKRFVSQTDGLSSLQQIADYHDQLVAPDTLELKTQGLGGEFGRGGHAGPVPFATNVPPFTFSPAAQRWFLRAWTYSFRRLWTADALNEIRQYAARFVDDRRSEGWKTREVTETCYAFDRVARWGSTSSRRIAGAGDVFTPFCSRAYVNYCFSLTSEERYGEASHWRILSALSPKLRDFPFLEPWKPRARRRVPFHASYKLVQMVLNKTGVTPRTHPGPPSYWTKWFDAHLDEHMELCLSVPDSPLWAWIDRSALEQAAHAEAPARARMREGLVRVATLFWYFHGRHSR